MFKFLIKKSFFAGVDNASALLVSNVISACLIGVFLLTAKIINKITPLTAIVIVVATTALLCLFLAGVYAMTNDWTCFKSAKIEAFKSALKNKKQHSLLFFLIITFIEFSVFICIPFYTSTKSYIGVFLALTLLWIVVILSIASMFFFPLCFFFPDDSAAQTLKKCFSFIMKEKGFTLLVFLKTICELALSLITCFILPGLTGVAINHNSAVKLIMIKSEHTTSSKTTKDMFLEETECIGLRSLKNLLHPWKE